MLKLINAELNRFVLFPRADRLMQVAIQCSEMSVMDYKSANKK